MALDTTERPRFTIFAGPNGSGNSTAYLRFLDAGYEVDEYLNADDIARKIRTAEYPSASVDLRAGREAVLRSRALIEAQRPFVRETTLSSREILRSVTAAKKADYRVVMVFIAVGSTAATKTRVALQVASAGHDIPEEAQDRRFPRAFENAPKVARIADAACFLDNSGFQHRLVATAHGGTVTFLDPQQAHWVEWALRDCLEQHHCFPERTPWLNCARRRNWVSLFKLRTGAPPILLDAGQTCPRCSINGSIDPN